MQQYTPAGKCPLAGNTVHMDRMFIGKCVAPLSQIALKHIRFMPRLVAHMHYRIVDVSSVKELVRRWMPDRAAAAPPKRLAHRSVWCPAVSFCDLACRALDDIRESIDELKYYRQHVFREV